MRTIARNGLMIAALLMTPIITHGAEASDSPPGTPGKSFTIEAFLQVPVLGSPTLSPDGEKVAYLRSQRSIEEDRRDRQIWIVDTAGGEPRQLTFAKSSIYGLAFRPDGALTYITSRDDDPPQVWLNPLDGAEPRAITDLEQGVMAYWWSPDGATLAVLAEGDAEVEPDGETEPESTEAESPEASEEEPETSKEEDLTEESPEGDWEVFDRLEHPEEYPQLWIVRPISAPSPTTRKESDEDETCEAARQLTHPPIHVLDLAWSPDGATIALTYHPLFSGLVDEDQWVGLVDVASGELTRISDPARHASLAAFSADGARLAYYTDREEQLRAYLNLKVIVIRDLESGAERVLTPDVEIALGGSGVTPAVAPTWSADGSALYLPAAKKTTRDLYRVDTSSGEITRMTRLEGNLGAYSIEGGTVAYLESELHRPGSLWLTSLEAPSEARELATTDEAVELFNLAPARKLTLPGHDGVTVEGFLFLPPGAKLEGRHPTIIEMHGGPYSRYGNSWTTRYPWQALSHNGFAVFIANPRGGTGYGEEFLRGVYRNFGTNDYLDLMAAVDGLVEQGIADPDRLGFTGYSYGGLMTNVVITSTDRFKAAVSIAGIFNYVSAMGQSNPQLFIDSYKQPWAGDLDRIWKHSPASRADRLRTPTLVMHGTEDKPVDPRQSVELFTYLQLNGVPSRLVLYPGEGHGINKPSHMLDYVTRELEWFRHWVLGDTEADGGKAPVPVEPTEGRDG